MPFHNLIEFTRPPIVSSFSRAFLNTCFLSFVIWNLELTYLAPEKPTFLAFGRTQLTFYTNVGRLDVLNCVPLFATPGTVAHQAPLSMEFSRKNTGVGCHFLLQGRMDTCMILLFYFPAKKKKSPCCCSVAKLCLTLQPHGLQHTQAPLSSTISQFVQIHVHWVSDAI